MCEKGIGGTKSVKRELVELKDLSHGTKQRFVTCSFASQLAKWETNIYSKDVQGSERSDVHKMRVGVPSKIYAHVCQIQLSNMTSKLPQFSNMASKFTQLSNTVSKAEHHDSDVSLSPDNTNVFSSPFCDTLASLLWVT